MDEDAAVAQYEGADAMAETMAGLRANMNLYGPLKALSEAEARRQYGDEAVTIIRPGLIVGPGDETDRFTYWPVRIARGGDVAAPGDGSDPVQFIDARDLAEWTIRMAETRSAGTFNATGPNYEMSMAAMLHGVRAGTTAGARLHWLPSGFLDEQGIHAWSDMPVWVPGVGDSAGFSRVSNRRSLQQGLTFRRFSETVGDTLAWFGGAANRASVGIACRPDSGQGARPVDEVRYSRVAQRYAGALGVLRCSGFDQVIALRDESRFSSVNRA